DIEIEHPRRGDAAANDHWQKQAISFSGHAAAKSGQLITKVPHRSGRCRFQRTETAKRKGEIEKQIWYAGKQVEDENAAHIGKISERNQRDLGEQGQRNVKPRSGDPGFGSIEQPKCS